MALKDEYFTVAQAADKLGVTKQTVYRWINNKELVAEKIGREMLISKKELSNYDEELFFRSFGNAITDKMGRMLQQAYLKDDTIADTEIVRPDPEEPSAQFVIQYKDGTSAKLTYGYAGYNVSEFDPANKRPMRFTVNFKTKFEEISSKDKADKVQKQ